MASGAFLFMAFFYSFLFIRLFNIEALYSNLITVFLGILVRGVGGWLGIVSYSTSFVFLKCC